MTKSKRILSNEEDANDENSLDEVSLAVTTKELTWQQYFKWHWWLFLNPQQPMRRPRATWAQVLRALGFRSVKALTMRNVDAGTIPDYIDVPIQRVKLFDLGILCFTMGFTSVKIEVESRKFTATGPFGSITTENILNFGKVLRFEGDMFAIHDDVRVASIAEITRGAAQTNGKLAFGSLISQGNFLSIQVMVESIINDWPREKFHSTMDGIMREEDDSMILGHVHREASLYRDLEKAGLKDQLKSSGELQGQVRPCTAS